MTTKNEIMQILSMNPHATETDILDVLKGRYTVMEVREALRVLCDEDKKVIASPVTYYSVIR